MPYKSQAQQAYFNAHRKELERQGVDVDEWNRASKGLRLPRHAKAKRKELPRSRQGLSYRRRR
jgi:hypothetical protein